MVTTNREELLHKILALQNQLNVLNEEYKDMIDMLNTIDSAEETLEEIFKELRKLNSEYAKKIKNLSSNHLKNKEIYLREINELKEKLKKEDEKYRYNAIETLKKHEDNIRALFSKYEEFKQKNEKCTQLFDENLFYIFNFEKESNILRSGKEQMPYRTIKLFYRYYK